MLITTLVLLLSYFSVNLTFKSLVFKNFNTKLYQSSKGTNFNDLFSDNLVEIKTPRKLKVEGTIPDYVRGTLLRNGPSLFGAVREGGRRYSHIFDGLAKIARFHFPGNGKVEFSTKFIRSRYYNRMVEKEKDVPPHLVLGPISPSFSKFSNIYGTATASFMYDNTCVNVHQIGGSNGTIMAVTDAPFMMEFDSESLDTVGKVKYPNGIATKGGIEFLSTAHPKSLPGDDVSFNYIFEYRPLSKENLAHIIRISKDNVRCIVGTVKIPQGFIPYIHEISITYNYAILFIYPLRTDPSTWVNGKGFLPQLIWEGNNNVTTKIHVFDISKYRNNNYIPDNNNVINKPIASYETDPMFAYHHINAYEDNNKTIVIDVVGYNNGDIINNEYGYAYINIMTNKEKRKHLVPAGTCFRYNLPIYNNKMKYIKKDILIAKDTNNNHYNSELLTINPLYHGKKYKYSYGYTTFAGDGKYRGDCLDWAIVKQNHQIYNNSNVLIWSEDNCYPQESLFIPKPNHNSNDNVSEDDGVLLSQVYDGIRRETFLLILDAITMKEIGRCYTGTRIPIAFHGKFYPH